MSEERPEYAAALTTQVGGNHYKDMPIQEAGGKVIVFDWESHRRTK